MAEATRTLVLRRERLVALAPEELGWVAGATRQDSCHVTFGWTCPTDPVLECLSPMTPTSPTVVGA